MSKISIYKKTIQSNPLILIPVIQIARNKLTTEDLREFLIFLLSNETMKENLKILNLDFNLITRAPIDLFNQFPNLRKISFRCNPLLSHEVERLRMWTEENLYIDVLNSVVYDISSLNSMLHTDNPQQFRLFFDDFFTHAHPTALQSGLKHLSDVLSHNSLISYKVLYFIFEKKMGFEQKYMKYIKTFYQPNYRSRIVGPPKGAIAIFPILHKGQVTFLNVFDVDRLVHFVIRSNLQYDCTFSYHAAMYCRYDGFGELYKILTHAVFMKVPRLISEITVNKNNQIQSSLFRYISKFGAGFAPFWLDIFKFVNQLLNGTSNAGRGLSVYKIYCSSCSHEKNLDALIDLAYFIFSVSLDLPENISTFIKVQVLFSIVKIFELNPSTPDIAIKKALLEENSHIIKSIIQRDKEDNQPILSICKNFIGMHKRSYVNELKAFQRQLTV